MTGVGLGKIQPEPSLDVPLRVRQALGRLSNPDLLRKWAITIDDNGRLVLLLNGTTLVDSDDGLKINPLGSPTIAGLTITGFSGFLLGTDGVVSAVNTVATTLASSVTQTGNTQPNETALFNATIPAATLASVGDSLEFSACGTFTAGSARRLRVRFGSDSSGVASNTVLLDTGSFTATASDWSLRGSVTRVDGTNQKNEVTIITTSTTTTAIDDYSNNGGGEYLKTSYSIVQKFNHADYTTSTETLANALYLSVTGFHASTSNVIIGERFKVIRQPG